MPSAANSENRAERTPDGFVLNIKVFRLLTGHQTPQASLLNDVQGELPVHFVEKNNLNCKDTPAEIHDEVWRCLFAKSAALRRERTGWGHYAGDPWGGHVDLIGLRTLLCRHRGAVLGRMEGETVSDYSAIAIPTLTT